MKKNQQQINKIINFAGK